MAVETHDVVVTRTIAAPVEQVWKALSDPELVKQWWGPTGFTCPVAEMDVRQGGTSLVCMQAPPEYGGFATYTTWSYSTVVPQERLEYALHFTDAQRAPAEPPPGVPDGVPHVVTLEALEGGRTVLTFTEYGYPTAEIHDMSKAGMEQCLDKMEAVFA
ncbi:SRPBCC domain-containing protein [Actinomycetes bacterium KLBMP 9759]